MTIPARLHARLRDERGFSVLLALFVLMITTTLLGATYAAVTNDTQLSRVDLDQQRAYAAAQAGIAQYVYELNQSPNYWSTCPGYPTPVAGTVPGSTDNGSTETYTYQPVTATTAPANDLHCDTASATATMIEGNGSAAPGTFRISVTGKSNNIQRTIVAQFKPPSFLDYVYYTDYETLDPAALYDPSSNPAEPTDCAVHYPNRGNDCGSPINFIAADHINGPLHSEDTLAVCSANGNGPTFGRSGYNDAVEAAGVSSEGQGSRNGCSSTPSYTVNNSSGSIDTSSPSLTPPSSNAQLLNIAQANGYVYTGRTTIVLTGSTMTVTSPGTTNTTAHPTGAGVTFPSNGVIFVSTASSGCGVTYTPFTANADYTSDTNCGNVYVSGNYTSSLTIASDNDIIIDGNITTTTTSGAAGAGNTAPSGAQLLGLVANDFVRVYNSVPLRTTVPPANYCGANNTNPPSATPPSPATGPITQIYAAILAVNHSFIVDNYDCGSALGTLTVWGAIAQLFRGPVGTGSGTVSTGYAKNYNYDNRLQTTEPPYFLNPVATAWVVARETECNGSTC